MKEIIGRAMARNKDGVRENVLLGHLSKASVKQPEKGQKKEGDKKIMNISEKLEFNRLENQKRLIIT